MFLPWSFFQMFLFFFFFQVLLSSGLGAALALYSRTHQGYAHSIRWVRQGGYVDMFRAISTSRRKLPGPIVQTLIATAFLSILISLAETGAKVFVKQAIRQANAAQEIIQTTPFITADNFADIEGWTTTVHPDSGIVSALSLTINNTRNIPDALPGRQYIPQQYPYESACDRLNLFGVHPNHTHLQVSNNGCANLSISFDNIFLPNVSRSYVTRRSNDRGTIVLPGRYETDVRWEFDTGVKSAEVATYVQMAISEDRKCLTTIANRNAIVPAQSGLTSSPKTVATKCLYPTGEIIALSVTSLRFSVPDPQSFRKVTSLIFEQQDDLLAGMEQSISEGLFSSLAADVLDGIHVAEVKTIGTENGTTYLMCAYTTAATVVTKPQAVLPEVAARRAGKPYAPYARYTIAIAAKHLPTSSNNTGPSGPRFATTSILNASMEAARYFASLGQNFYIDWTGGNILLIFVTTDMQKGYEIPLWLFAAVTGLMAGSFALVMLVEFSLEDKFKRSLHWMVSKELEPRLGRRAPTLMRFRAEPLSLENARLAYVGKPLISHK
ncbi:hypothetical protein BGZ70_005857 [Mortierella alpina]|uniref:Uncharacterized protein n=1 Tax=Mortierella alpina TaxID=64518 RepID=A0A9P6M3D5_MORAP|nr:hypothetical protein BGZ70_005857 [Mortierella alpina]